MAAKPDARGAWTRASLDLAIVAVLTESDRHGYALAQRLGELGFGQIKGGALYPVLNRLEAEGAVISTWQAGDGGPGRKVYTLAPAGLQKLRAERTLWRDFAATMNDLLERVVEEQER